MRGIVEFFGIKYAFINLHTIVPPRPSSRLAAQKAIGVKPEPARVYHFIKMVCILYDKEFCKLTLASSRQLCYGLLQASPAKARSRAFFRIDSLLVSVPG